MQNQLIEGNCFDVMESMEKGSIDSIISDPPYNLTMLDFDKQEIDWLRFWALAKPLLKDKSSPIILFCQQPFATDLIISNRRWWRDELVYQKTAPTGFLNAKVRPLKTHELIEIFSEAKTVYNPQMDMVGKSTGVVTGADDTKTTMYKKHNRTEYKTGNKRYPVSVWTFSQRRGEESYHPTQKPIALMERLILTYTNPGAVVFDPFSGSGSTLVAAQNTGRVYVGCELNPEYAEITRKRLAQPYTLPMFGD